MLVLVFLAIESCFIIFNSESSSLEKAATASFVDLRRSFGCDFDLLGCGLEIFAIEIGRLFFILIFDILKVPGQDHASSCVIRAVSVAHFRPLQF